MVTYTRSDLEFILEQIVIAEEHVAAGESRADLLELVGDASQGLGLRTVDGTLNNLRPGQSDFGAADQPFLELVPPQYLPQYDLTLDPSGNVFDSGPRVVSNLIADMTSNNPAATAAYEANIENGATRTLIEGTEGAPDAVYLYAIPNVAFDAGLSAPYNSWMTLFGQFFDHGLDHINKGGSGTVFIQLLPDDPLWNPAPGAPNFMLVTRATRDADGNTINSTTPFVDQNQTYASHASHQAFLREYVLNDDGVPVATGRLIEGEDGGMATWADVKAQARGVLGIELDDLDVLNVPLIATDIYGNFIPGDNGFPQLVIGPNTLVEGDRTAPVDASDALRTNHAFLLDINNSANPSAPGYNAALLDAHFMAGDGRANENFGLVAVHQVFHAEHNRLLEHTKELVLAEDDLDFLNQWLAVEVNDLPANQAEIDALIWNGERLFQAAKFGTEMQYQHLVFEEFARKMQPNIGEFDSYDVTIDPAIAAEFANVVYRFGHSMLNESVDRYDANFDAHHTGLIEAFLNPLGYNQLSGQHVDAEEAAAAVVRGMTRQVGNEIDEFVTDALRDNLLGLPLDLAAINIARARETGSPTLNAARAVFFDQTGDEKLRPYESWIDFAFGLKTQASIVNFIAAYGTHSTITTETTVAGKRLAATNLVFGGGGLDEDDRQDFLNGTGDYAGNKGGLNNVEFWIGGLAEKIQPFGGMLGSTFAFVFETQLEKLQNGDRFYYLERLEGLELLNEIENNTFSAMVTRNTGATHLPFDIFSTPDYFLEVDQSEQFNEGLGSDDPTGDPGDLIPLVIRNNPATSGIDTNYLRYTGDEHVVLGGTNGADIIIGGGGDDSIWGDGGNDRIEGGDGNDEIDGGAGDDIITDLGGDDVIRGGDGNDVIQPGGGLDAVLGGAGQDAILTSPGSAAEIFGGTGNDFMLGSDTGAMQGNEGHDWMEGGNAGSVGDNDDPLELHQGHDVFIGDGSDERMDGGGGDDIFVGSLGNDRMFGRSGWDWVTYKNSDGVEVDLNSDALGLEFPIVPQRFLHVEGISGSSGDDTLIGTDFTIDDIALEGVSGSLLNAAGIARIAGLAALLPAGATSFGAGNIMLGGGGDDVIEGRGGNDIIDGDKWLDVEIQVGSGPSAFRISSLNEIRTELLDGTINPGQLSIVRSIKDGAEAEDIDVAVFTGNRAQYSIQRLADRVVVTDSVANRDGSDTLFGVEIIRFADRDVFTDQQAPIGAPIISDETPTQGFTLGVDTSTIDDPNGIDGPFSFQWQALIGGVWQDVGTGATFTPGAGQVGRQLRVIASFTDGIGTLESVTSDPTGVVGANFVGTALADVFDGTAGDDVANGGDGDDTLRGFAGNDILNGQGGNDFLDGGEGADVMSGGTGNDVFIVDDVGDVVIEAASQGTDEIRTTLNVYALGSASVERLTFIGTGDFVGTGNGLGNRITGGDGDDTLDGRGGADTMIGGEGDDTYFVNSVNDVVVELSGEGLDHVFASATTTLSSNVENLTLTGTNAISGTGNGLANVITGNSRGNTLNGGGGADDLFGLGGADTLNGGTGADLLDGGTGADTLNGGRGADILIGGSGNDFMNGGSGNDTFIFETGFGADRISGFDSNPTGGQDLLDISGTGISAATFSTVGIQASGTGGVNTLITIGADTITLLNVARTTISEDDFILAL
jgi:Ca2+-binding RTX toxin-like protein